MKSENPLRVAREARGIPLEALASIVKSTPEVLRAAERGACALPPAVVIRLARALAIDREALAPLLRPPMPHPNRGAAQTRNFPLRPLRKARGFSMEQVGSAVGRTGAWVGLIERGLFNLDPAQLDTIAALLEVDRAALAIHLGRPGRDAEAGGAP